MKECKSKGMYGDVCRANEFCLLGKEWDGGETSIAYEYFVQNCCPKDVLEKVKSVWDERQRQLNTVLKKIEESGE